MRLPVHAQHLDLARIGWRQPFADFDGGGLAGAVGTQQAETLARPHVQIEAVDGDHVFVRLAQVADTQGGRGRECGHLFQYRMGADLGGSVTTPPVSGF